MSKLKFTLSMC